MDLVNYSYSYDYTADYDEFVYEDTISSEIKSFHLYVVVCYTLVFCISVPGNGFLLWVLLRERAWKTTPDILHLQLIISDLCLTVTLPVWACYLHQDWMIHVWAFGVLRGATLLGLNSYAVILTAMTLYCYVAVVHPSRLSTQAPKKFGVLVVSIVIWLVCAAASIKVSVSLTVLPFDICMQNGLFFLIPFIIIMFCYVHIYITIKECRINRHNEASRLILGMIVVFVLCMVPFYITSFVQSLLQVNVLKTTLEWLMAMFYAKFIYALAYFHCCLNPLLYIFGAQRFRRHLPLPNTSSQRRDQESEPLAVIPPHDASM